ncbi:hypothetical protein OKW50_008181 [Paraburkholderia youngii]
MDEPPSRSKDNGNICIAPSTSKTTRLIFLCALVVTKLRRAVTFRRPLTGTASPETFTVDKSGAKLAALEAINAERETPIRSRKNKHRNNVVELVSESRFGKTIIAHISRMYPLRGSVLSKQSIL